MAGGHRSTCLWVHDAPCPVACAPSLGNPLGRVCDGEQVPRAPSLAAGTATPEEVRRGRPGELPVPSGGRPLWVKAVTLVP